MTSSAHLNVEKPWSLLYFEINRIAFFAVVAKHRIAPTPCVPPQAEWECTNDSKYNISMFCCEFSCFKPVFNEKSVFYMFFSIFTGFFDEISSISISALAFCISTSISMERCSRNFMSEGKENRYFSFRDIHSSSDLSLSGNERCRNSDRGENSTDSRAMQKPPDAVESDRLNHFYAFSRK